MNKFNKLYKMIIEDIESSNQYTPNEQEITEIVGQMLDDWDWDNYNYEEVENININDLAIVIVDYLKDQTFKDEDELRDKAYDLIEERISSFIND